MAYRNYRDLIRQMEREMQQLSDEAFRGFFGTGVGGTDRFWQPPVDIHETSDTVVAKMELAGARAEEIQVSLSSDSRVLTISGARTEGHADREGRLRCHQLEVYFGPFERPIALPASVEIDRERVTAKYRDGFLVVTMHKKAAREAPKRRTIPITNEDRHEAKSESEGEE
jgi:HSP20 family protein